MKNRKPTILKTGRWLALILAVSLFIAPSCEHDYEWELPLAIDHNALIFSTDAGTEHVLVYSTGNWTASFTEERSWITMRKASGSGIGDIILDFEENRGIDRRANLVVRANGLEKYISITQTGSIAEPILQLPSQKTVSAEGGAIVLEFFTNMGEALELIKVRVVCLDEEGEELAGTEPWIGNIEIAEEEVTCVAEPNTTGVSRKLRLTLEIDDEVNEMFYSTSVLLEQPAKTE